MGNWAIKIFFALLLFGIFNSKAQSKKIRYTYDLLYGLKVKQVDEFIDRFNNETEYVEKGVFKKIENPKEQRRILINTLFNKENKFDLNSKEKLIRQVIDPNKPVFLSFYDQSWFAKVKCKVLFKNTLNDLELTLRIQINPDLSSKWVIIGAKAPFLHLPNPKSKSAHINPSNHNVRFSKLPKVMQDTVNLRNYVNREFREDRLTLLFYEIMNDNIRVESIDDISFHFLQIDNWLFVVRNFNRRKSNAGWLIDEIKEVTWEQKGQYLVDELSLY